MRIFEVYSAYYCWERIVGDLVAVVVAYVVVSIARETGSAVEGMLR